MQGMFLHVLADTLGMFLPSHLALLGSVGVIISSILIELYGWTLSDPICSMFIAVMILGSVWPLLKSSALALLQRVPVGYEDKITNACRLVSYLE
jgi:zinc transporter 5/7